MQQQGKLFKGAPRAKAIQGDGHDEHWHQARFITWCRDSARLQTNPHLQQALEWLHAIPNGAYVHRTQTDRGFKRKRAPRQASKLVAEGLTSGVYDLRVDYVLRDSNGAINCPGMIIEMKMPGRYLSDEQKAYRDFMHAQGFRDVLCRNWIEAAHSVIEYMKLEKHAPIYTGGQKN